MRKRFPIFFVVFLIVIVSSMVLFPTLLFAAPFQWSGNNHYYEVIKYNDQNGGPFWTEAKNLAQSSTFNDGLNTYAGHLVTITSSEENAFILSIFPDTSSYWIGAYQIPDSSAENIGWCWVNNESFVYSNWASGEPNDNGDGEENNEENYAFMNSSGSWVDIDNELFFTSGYIVEYDEILPPETLQTEAAKPVWVRDSEMKCKAIWINEDGYFQFSFIYPYADNNWVKIYDMSGKLVYEVDMPYDNPNIIVDLPDGMYTVKTFTAGSTSPIQTFVIGK
jgi:hypothetical protein